jgi:hypothetical protein
MRSIYSVVLGLCWCASPLCGDGPVTISGRIQDDQGSLLPARLTIRNGDGELFFARSAQSDGAAVRYDKSRAPESTERHTTLSAHPFEADLPPGRYTFLAERGKEYVPARAEVIIGDGARPLELTLARWIDLAGRGWYSGDTHVHRSVAELPNVMLAEDLNVALPLSYWVRDAYTPPERGDLSQPGEPRLTTIDDTHVFWPVNTEYEIFTVNGQRHTLGAVFVLNHRTPLEPGAPPVKPIAAEARAQRALLDLDKHSWPWSLMLVPVMNVDLFELTNNHIWATEFYFRQWTTGVQPQGWEIETDARGWTEWGWMDFGFKTYYALLNCGFRMRPSAGTASGVHPVPLGFGRVYVHLPDGFSYDGWIEGLNAGRSFVTTGPMLLCTFNGSDPGASSTHTGPTRLRIAGSAESLHPLERIEIIQNGEMVRSLPIQPPLEAERPHVVIFDVDLTIDSSSWVVVRCFERLPSGRVQFAHTAPVHLDVAGRPLRPRRREVEYFVQRMQEELSSNQGVLAPDELAEYEQALATYRRLLDSAE